MNKRTDTIIRLDTVEQFCRFFGCPSARHPLMAMCRLDELHSVDIPAQPVQSQLYTILIKQGATCNAMYGWREYDFTKGTLNFFAPGQMHTWGTPTAAPTWGYVLVFHPNFVRRFALGEKIQKLRFFSYDVAEALHISDDERKTIEGLLTNFENEYYHGIDEQTQTIIVSMLDVLLSYSQRFYTRQFITRAAVESDVPTRFMRIIEQHYAHDDAQAISIAEIARRMSMSPHYLSDCLRAATGQTAQQHLHTYLIERAKTMLLSTDLTVSEIAYRLGFEYPQYFTRLFKKENRPNAAFDERWQIFKDIPAKHKGINLAPLIGEVDITPALASGQIKNVNLGGEGFGFNRPCHYEWIKRVSDDCARYKVNFTLNAIGSVFVKDGKTYRIDSQELQGKQAYRSGLSHFFGKPRYKLYHPADGHLLENGELMVP